MHDTRIGRIFILSAQNVSDVFIRCTGVDNQGQPTLLRCVYMHQKRGFLNLCAVA